VDRPAVRISLAIYRFIVLGIKSRRIVPYHYFHASYAGRGNDSHREAEAENAL
jgi:hypothetical protein